MPSKGDVQYDDRFEEFYKKLGEEHNRQVSDLRKETYELKERLNSVLSATWRFTDEGWSGQGANQAEACNLMLSKDQGGKSEDMWQVSGSYQEGKIALSANAFKVRPYWNGNQPEVKEASAEKLATAREGRAEMKRQYTSERNEKPMIFVGKSEIGLGKFVLDPKGKKKNTWDFISIAMVFYDFIMVPLGAFDPPDNLFFIAMNWITLLFWTCDMAVSCMSGYEYQNKVIMDPKKIVINYCKTRLAFDTLVNGIDWIFAVLEIISDASGGDNAGSEVGRALKARRIFRIARLYRLIKVSKVGKMIWIIMEETESDLVFVLPTCASLFILVIVCGHVLGTIWYCVGLIGQSTNANNWIDAFLQGQPWQFRYMSAFWWTVNKLALSATDIEPQNSSETVYALCIMICGFFIFFYYAASFNGSMQTLNSVRSATFKETFMLRGYLKQRFVPTNLAFRITNYVDRVCRPEMELIPESKLMVLPMLSKPLRSELKCAVLFAGLFVHPLFEATKHNQAVLQGLGDNALMGVAFAVGDMVFMMGTECKNMVMLSQGQMRYLKMGVIDCTLHPADWLCEAAIWTFWAHRGDCRASKDAQAILVDIFQLWEIISKDPEMFALFSEYAEKFLEHLNEQTASTGQIIDVTIGRVEIPQIEQMVKSCESHPDHHYSTKHDEGDSSPRGHKKLVRKLTKKLNSREKLDE